MPPFAYYDFHDACDWHDLCYTHHYYGDGFDGRKGCDDGFLERMKGWCGHRYNSWHETSCNVAADIYYAGVRALGGSHF